MKMDVVVVIIIKKDHHCRLYSMNVTGNNTQHDLLSKCDKNSTGVSAAEEFWRYVRLPMLTVCLLRMCECVLILLCFCCCCLALLVHASCE